MGAAGRLKPGSREKRHTHRHTIRRQAGQGERAGNQAEESEERGETVSFQGPVSRPQDRAELSGSSPPSLPGLARNLDSRGGVSEGKGTRADAGVDILVQGQVVSLLQVQEEEPV